MATPGMPSGVNHSSESQKWGRKAGRARQLAVELLDPQREIGALDLQVELAELHVEQFLVAQGSQLLGPESAKRRPRHGP